MKKTLIISLALSVSLISACGNTETSAVKNGNEKLKSDMTSLNKNMDKLENQVEIFKKEKEQFPLISILSREFVQAHTSGDKERIQKLISNDISLINKGNQLYAKTDNYEWLLFSNDKNNQYEDWVIQGYNYNNENETMNIYIREFYVDSQGKPVSPPTFLSLTFKKINDEWKISSLNFDV